MAAGVQGVEAALGEELAGSLAQAADPGGLRASLRVIVPSGSLRDHVAAWLLRFLGRSVAGVRIQTLDGLAQEVIERAGRGGVEGALFHLLVAREVRREPALAEGLEDRLDADLAVVAAVDDLLDAGFELPHAEVLDEHLRDQPWTAAGTSRARAVVRVAARISAAIESGRCGHHSQRFVWARRCLEAQPGLLVHGGLLLHGFADATGVQADWIEALVRRHGARLILDLPSDPTAPSRNAAGRFGEGFRARFSEVASAPEASERQAPDLCLLRAPSAAAEARDVALRLQRRLEAGAVPERLAVVARDWSPYRVLMPTQLRRLGVPFSGRSERGGATAARRRLDALAHCVSATGSPRMEAWLSARADLDLRRRADLREALHRHGVVRLEDVATCVAEAPGSVSLESRVGLQASVEAAPRSVAGRVSAGDWAAAGERAAVLLAALNARPQRAPIGEHRAWLQALAREALDWHEEAPGATELSAALAEFAEDELVSAAEFFSLWTRALKDAGFAPLGGAGGGVQLLSVMEARARSFDEVFLIGLVRGGFPRSIQEDPLLPDAVRVRLREVLPDLPVKRDGFDEERFLFAQLLSSAPRLTLSWPETSAEGRPQPRSPLVDVVARADQAPTERAEPLHVASAATAGLPAAERALLMGLHGSRQQFRRALTNAVGPERADARMAVLEELDGQRSGLGPYFGFVGPAAGSVDPRGAPLYVTQLEDVARCPWQAFLRRVLRIGPVPDAGGDLPSAKDPRRLGNVVHRVLELITQPPNEPTADAAAALEARRPHVPEWPADAALDALLERAAVEELREDAVSLPSYARVLARRARPFLERAREQDWADGGPNVIAIEYESSLSVGDTGAGRSLFFRADRVDRAGDRLVFTDYKTGRAIADQKTAKARAEAFRRDVAAGRALQAMLYARAGGPKAEGRYLFLREDTPDEARALVAEDVTPLSEEFDASLATLLDVWDLGSFVPRLRLADRDEEPQPCRFCDVRDACLRGDSGSRRRLERFASSDASRNESERAAEAVYRLGSTT